MFKILRRRHDRPSVMYGMFQRLGSSIERKQRKAADYLNNKVARYSKRQLITGLFLFCGIFGGCSAWVIWQAFRQPAVTVQVKSISIPKHAISDDRYEDHPQAGLLTKEEIDNISSFQQYLDSLQQTTKGKASYDSLVQHRPGLLDSLAFIQQIYSEQLKTK